MEVEPQQNLWDRFLVQWPVSAIEVMTLEQYVSVEDKTTFTYWLETEARMLGSIKGGSSEKFGIYKRANPSKRNNRNNYQHDDIYTWHSKYGDNAQMAFNTMKQYIIDVIAAVKAGELAAVDAIDIAPTLKWKVAFIYQDRSSPKVLNIYKESVLRRAVQDGRCTMGQAYAKLIEKMPSNIALIDYAGDIWENNQAASETEIDQLLENMAMDAANNLSNAKKQQLYELTEWANDAGLDIYPVNIENQFRIGRKSLGRDKSESTFRIVSIQKSKIKLGDADFSYALLASLEDEIKQFAEEYSMDRDPYWPINYAVTTTLPIQSLNQILYGPPGTGKTYHTVEAAVKAAEPRFTWQYREELKAEYDRLVDEKRIRFVTFHQSYGYEEFVEGLVAETTEDKQVAYRIKDGVFKKICDDAAVSELHADPAIETNGRVWKLSIEGAHQNSTKTYCLENNLGAIGWGDTGDLSKEARNEYFKSQGTNNQNSLMYFCHEMAIGDLVLCIDSKTSVEAVGVVTGEYRYAEEGLPSRDDYCHQLPIKWLAKGFSVDFKSLNDNKQFSLPTCYPLSRLSVGDVLSHLQSHHVQVGEAPAVSVTEQKQNFVLVIDEINRGNISKIFGELITLIEDSKRGGGEETISLTLPYSNKPFSVPENLYLIGTMNTADRSLSMMDTALRRRFDFMEMMPNPSLLRGAVVKGVDLEKLLQTLNERIEVLYDREHTLGHAFFMPVKALSDENKEEEAFAKLVSVFQNKIIPLLQEYFFEDWHKIRLVLADNQRDVSLQFVTEKTLDDKQLSGLFGSNHGMNSYGQPEKQYSLKTFDHAVWSEPEAYVGIYSPKGEKSKVVESDAENS